MITRNQHSWDYHRDGDWLHAIGIVVKYLITPGRTMRTTVYLCRHQCCGKLVELTHWQLSRRYTSGSKRCDECARKQGIKTRMKKRTKARARPARAGHLWPVPSWVPIGEHVVWEDRMQAGDRSL